jgi:hypothetical protein
MQVIAMRKSNPNIRNNDRNFRMRDHYFTVILTEYEKLGDIKNTN